MRGTFVRFGIDRCPATKNYSSASFCHQCDFFCKEKKEQCECSFFQFSKKGESSTSHPFTSFYP